MAISVNVLFAQFFVIRVSPEQEAYRTHRIECYLLSNNLICVFHEYFILITFLLQT